MSVDGRGSVKVRRGIAGHCFAQDMDAYCPVFRGVARDYKSSVRTQPCLRAAMPINAYGAAFAVSVALIHSFRSISVWCGVSKPVHLLEQQTIDT